MGFANLGQFEKIAWSVPIDFNSNAFLVEHRKFGVGVFAREGEQWKRDAKVIVSSINKAAKAAKPFFKWMAEEAVAKSKFNIKNLGQQLFARYSFFVSEFRKVTLEVESLRTIYRAEQHQRNLGFRLYSHQPNTNADAQKKIRLFTIPWIAKSKDASWFAVAAIEAFYSWTEHVFIHLAILQCRITSGTQVAQIAEADWAKKFKCAFDISEKKTKGHFDKLIDIRRQLRNYVAHGAFGKGGEAFSFHSQAGAVPVAFDYAAKKPTFSLTPELAFEDTEAIAVIEDFIAYLWSGLREPARLYIQESNLPLILPHASDGIYAASMKLVSSMEDFVYYRQAEWDRAGNMDW